MADEFDQYKVTSAQPATDEFAQYKATAPDFSANPPGVKRPTLNMHESYLTGNPNEAPVGLGKELAGMALGQAKSTYEVSTPNIAMQLINRYRGKPSNAQELPAKMAMQMIPLLAGGMDAPVEPPVPVGWRAAQSQPLAPAEALSQLKAAAVPPTISVQLKMAQAKVDPYSGPRIPTMEPAQSGTIGLHGYHPESQTMMVQFKNGKVYELRGVPQEVYDAYKNSESQGSFYQQNLKGRYTTNFRGNAKGAK